jgi:hypothetical protein
VTSTGSFIGVASRIRDLSGTSTLLLAEAAGPPGHGSRHGHSARASGGYAGDIDPREVAGVVHGREFVFGEETMKRNRALFELETAPGVRERGYVTPVNGSSGTAVGAAALPRQVQL